MFSLDALIFLVGSLAVSAMLLASHQHAPTGSPELDALVQDAVEVCTLNLTLDEGCFSYALQMANHLVGFCLGNCNAPVGSISAVVERDYPAEFNFTRLVAWVAP